MKHACLFDSQGSFGPSIVLPANLPRQTGVLFKNGPGGLKHQVRYLIPENPGIYGLKDNNGALFYVGKAKNLRARLLSYFRKKPSKEKKLIRKAASLIWENTFTEFLALLRELEVINLKRPLANVAGKICAFRAGYLILTPGPAPKLKVTAFSPKNTKTRIGPFRNNRAMKNAVKVLNDYFQMRDCPSRIPMVFSDSPPLGGAFPGFACIRQEIGKCLGPCGGGCTQGEYGKKVKALMGFFSGKEQEVLEVLECKRKLAADRLDFEMAQNYQENVEALRYLLEVIQKVKRGQAIHGLYEQKVSSELTLWTSICHGVVRATVFSGSLRAGEAGQKALIKPVTETEGGETPVWWEFSQYSCGEVVSEEPGTSQGTHSS